MAVNSIFHTNNLTSLKSERNLYSDLIKEAIQIHGHDVYYMDRQSVAADTIFGEDALNKFNTQHPIEMYVEDGEGYAGDKEIMTQFGLENRNEITFVVHKKRFQEMDRQVQIEDGTDSSSSGSILLEAGTLDQSTLSATLNTVTKSFIFDENAEKIVLEDDNEGRILSEESGSEFYLTLDTAATDADRPQEGDLVYHPIVNKIFQINFVDHDEPFHQLDNNPIYKLKCQQYEYSSEVLDTGIEAIDEIEDDNTTDTLAHQFTLEQSSAVNENIRLENGVIHGEGVLLEETDGDNITFENDSTSVGDNIALEIGSDDSGITAYLIQETYIVGDSNTTKTAPLEQNELFDTEDDNILDFTEKNPFGDAGD